MAIQDYKKLIGDSQVTTGQSLKMDYVVTKMLLFIVAACLVFSVNTLYSNIGDRSGQTALCAITFACSLAAVLFMWVSQPLSKTFAQRYLPYVIFVFAIYCLVGDVTHSFGGRGMLIAILNIVLMPLFVELLWKSGQFQFLLSSFVDIVLFLALSSVLLWLVGPVLGIVAPNCSIASNWNSLGEETVQPGWYGLLYATQYADNSLLIRNTGIFCEAPMYSFVLCMALLFERYLRKKPRPIICIILAITICTTVSTTGLIILLLIVAQTLYAIADRFSPKVKMLCMMFFLLCLIGIAYLGFLLLSQKVGTGSGLTRLDDYQAGFQAWMENVLVGNGFSGRDVSAALERHMAGFRSMNVGFSNSLMYVLAQGGLLWLSVFIPPILGFLYLGKDKRYGMFCFVILWVLTIVSVLPLTLFSFGIGSASLFSHVGGPVSVSSPPDSRKVPQLVVHI